MNGITLAVLMVILHSANASKSLKGSVPPSDPSGMQLIEAYGNFLPTPCHNYIKSSNAKDPIRIRYCELLGLFGTIPVHNEQWQFKKVKETLEAEVKECSSVGVGAITLVAERVKRLEEIKRDVEEYVKSREWVVVDERRNGSVMTAKALSHLITTQRLTASSLPNTNSNSSNGNHLSWTEYLIGQPTRIDDDMVMSRIWMPFHQLRVAQSEGATTVPMMPPTNLKLSGDGKSVVLVDDWNPRKHIIDDYNPSEPKSNSNTNSNNTDNNIYGDLQEPYKETIFNFADWKRLFDDQGRLIVKVSECICTFRTRRLLYSLNKQAWLRLLGIRDWHKTDQEFEIEQLVALRDFEKAFEQSELLSKQVETDIERETVNKEMLRAVLRVFFVQHPTTPYIQGYTALAATCLQAVGLHKEYDPQSTCMAYSLFKALMRHHWLPNFEHDFAKISSNSVLITMTILKEQDPKLHDAISKNLGATPLGFLILPEYLLWMRQEVYGAVPTVERISRLLALWTTLLCFPDPNRAVAVLIAAMILEESRLAMFLASSASNSLAQLFTGVTVWDFKRIIDRMIQLY